MPEKECAELKAMLSFVTYGWGMIPVMARIGKTHWTTAMWPKDGGYILPLKVSVRKGEKLEEGDRVTVQLQVG